MSTCATCKHWEPPSGRTGFGDVLSMKPPADLPATEGYRVARKAQEQADKLFGECGAIFLRDDLEIGEPPPLAVAMDGSGYRANIYTQAEFGCAMREAKS